MRRDCRGGEGSGGHGRGGDKDGERRREKRGGKERKEVRREERREREEENTNEFVSKAKLTGSAGRFSGGESPVTRGRDITADRQDDSDKRRKRQ